MISPSQEIASLRRLCVAFIRIFEAYVSKIRLIQNPSDLVLKILPMDWVSSTSTITSSSPAKYTRLAKELYDRCPTLKLDASPYASASLFQLANPIPKSIEFKLSADFISSPFQHESAIHIGYSWELTSMWLSSALTDTLGCHHWTASYYFGPSFDPWIIFQAVAKEIWEIMLEAMNASQGNRRLFVAKDKPMTTKEIDGKSCPQLYLIVLT